MSHHTEDIPISELRPHERNYRVHPEDQLEHIVASIKEHGFYRNIVVARDGTILAGHGVVQAATKMGLEVVPCIRLDLDPNDPQALKVLVGDNEIGKLGVVDDRVLLELVSAISETNPDNDLLMGTGLDANMVSALEYVSRPPDQITGFTPEDAGAEWAAAGMPEYDIGDDPYRLVVNFKTPEERSAFLVDLGAVVITHKGGKDGKDGPGDRSRVASIAWPLQNSKKDRINVKFVSEPS